MNMCSYGNAESGIRQHTAHSQQGSSGAACDKNTPRNLHVCEEVPFSSSHKWSALSIDDATQRGIYVMGAPEILQPYLRNGTELEALIEEGATRGLRMVLF